MSPCKCLGHSWSVYLSALLWCLALLLCGFAMAPDHLNTNNFAHIYATSTQASISLFYGQTVTGTIVTERQVVTYTFTAEAGDIVLAGMGDTEHTFNPQIHLYTMDGTLLKASDIGYNYVELTHTLTAAGVYTLLVGDADANAATTYNLSLQRLNPPANAAPLTYGQTITNTMLLYTEYDAYTFTAEAGDIILAGMGDDVHIFNPQIRLYAGDGTLLKSSDVGYNYIELTHTLAAAGVYTLLVGDADANAATTYNLSLQRLNPPANAISLTYGQTITNTMQLYTEYDAYTFTANAGDVVMAGVNDSVHIFNPQIHLYNTDGTLLKLSDVGYNYIELSHTVTVGGVFSLLVGDSDGNSPATYTLGFDQLDNNEQSIAFGQIITSEIDPIGEQDSFTFNGVAGQRVTTFLRNLAPRDAFSLRLTRPDGIDWFCNFSLGDCQITDITLPIAGVYTLIVDGHDSSRGLYSLNLECLDKCPSLNVWPSRGGNTGNVTLTITGQYLDPNSSVKLAKVNETDIFATRVISTSDRSRLLVTFDLTNKPPGTWDLVINDSVGAIIKLEAIFQIINGGGGELALDLIGPSIVRVGRGAKFTAVVRNEGLNDIELVLIEVIAQVDRAYQAGNQIAQPLSQAYQVVDLAPGSAASTPLLITPGGPDCIDISANATAFSESEDGSNLEDLTCDELRKEKAKLERYLNLARKALALIRESLTELLLEFTILDCEGDPRIEDLLKCIELEIEIEEQVQLEDKVVTYEAGFKARVEQIKEIMKQKNCPDEDLPPEDPLDEETTLSFCPITAWDPNDKSGALGPGEAKYVPRDIAFLPYTIFFENLAAATAAAEEVLLTDQLDSNLDWSTFAMDTIRIGGKSITVPTGAQNFTTTVDLRPAVPALVDVNVRYNPSTGSIEWFFRGKNSDTGELTGFLPPNTVDVAPLGEGSVSYTVKPKQNLPSGTVIRNQATIDFEVDIPPAPMDTPEVFNTIDADIPASQVLPLNTTQQGSSFNVQWSGADVGSGIGAYTIYVSDNGSPYQPWLTNVISTTAAFAGSPGHTYQFFSRARDKVGNYEDLRMAADATVFILHELYLPLVVDNSE